MPRLEAFGDVEVWYHTIDLPAGTTPGQVDLRRVAHRVLPGSLAGLRALDVGTFDGFWAFEMERRGAREVLALDVASIDGAQWHPRRREELRRRAQEWGIDLGKGFAHARAALGSGVERVVGTVHDVTPEQLGGPVDVVFVGSLLLHLRDPVGALEALHACLRPGGTLLQMEPFSVRATLGSPRRARAELQTTRTEFNWWYPNAATLRAWTWTAGFEDVRRTGVLRPPSTPDMRQWYLGLKARRP